MSERLDLDRFDGGFTLEEHAGAFRDGMWFRLDGLVFDGPNRLRTQWLLDRHDEFEEPHEYAVGPGGILVAVGRTSGAVKAAPPDGPEMTWTDIEVYDYNAGTPTLSSATMSVGAGPLATSDSYIVGRAALDGAFGEEYPSGLVIKDGNDYWVIVSQTRAYEFAGSFDGVSTIGSGAPSDAAMVGQWADFTIFCGIYWYEDPDAATGARKWDNAMWFSEPGQFEAYDPLDVIILPPAGGEEPTRIYDLVTLQDGLMVFTDVGTYFFRGTADNFAIETLTTGQSTALGAERGAAYFEPLRVAVWADRDGRVWASDGATLRRLDEGLGLPLEPLSPGDIDDYSGASVATFGTQLMVGGRSEHLLCFQLLTRELGVWTRLVLPDFDDTGSAAFGAVMLLENTAQDRIHLLHRDESGSFSSRLLGFNVSEAETMRGQYRWWDGAAVQSEQTTATLGTRVLSVGPHQRAWWRRVGVRFGRTTDVEAQVIDLTQWTTGGATDSRSDGTFSDVQTPDGMSWNTAVFTKVVHRKHMIFPSIGPSRYLRAVFTFGGDVTVEGVSVWGDGASQDRGRAEAQAGSDGVV